ncbi:Ornithine aminotransferase car2 [Zancudomyces culisetae]|uniref:Ornithine aminotransferase n=1 Tax=Zancudomyces culisetae TaxID=1213189 RepID=A0A1R1PUY6_ZANCU|nr:Ornithine aminotransferase car2 [Zancudomyces culisetae]|eukprot:OMH84770.1 Ornithine aminotransferase car2 [Zancudomyces culisetae]
MASIRNDLSSKEAIELDAKYGAHNYHPIPVVISKGEGVHVWDPEGNKYYDFLSAYSAVNQGHCHPKILNAMIDQAKLVTLSSRAFYNDKLGQFAKYITELFGYDMLLPANSGAEAVESAIKIARRWAYDVKGVPNNEAIVLAAEGNFHGRTTGVISMSTDPESYERFGPFLPLVGASCPNGKHVIRFNHAEDLEEVLEAHGDKVAAFLVEPIQGEAGIMVPDSGYLKRCYDLCKKHNVLFIADEIQTGLARTGNMLACEHDGVRPDIVLLGKALSGGFLPVSAILSSKDILLLIKPGEHGSTYGGCPIACATAIAALEVLVEENLCEKSRVLGERLRGGLNKIQSPVIKEIRGRGLLNAIEVNPASCKGKTAWDLCLLLKDNGLLCKPTHDTIIRLAPPLIITEEQIDECVEIISKCVQEFSA